jgi:REP element-mobilizing transposase RayT
MKRYSGRFIIKSSRIKNWDYSTPGIYFITLCTEDHEHLFGKINEGKMIYSKNGEIAVGCLKNINKHFDNVCLKAFVVMPNHVHILFHVETHHGASLQDNRRVGLVKYNHCNHPDYFLRLNEFSNQKVPVIIKQYKSSVKRFANFNKIFFAWQTRYFDEIIEDEKRFNTIKYYIRNNPKNWDKDKLNK